jgi:hypothetical protein
MFRTGSDCRPDPPSSEGRKRDVGEAPFLTGVARRTVEVRVAEIGVDTSVSPTAGHSRLGRDGVPATTSRPADGDPD